MVSCAGWWWEKHIERKSTVLERSQSRVEVDVGPSPPTRAQEKNKKSPLLLSSELGTLLFLLVEVLLLLLELRLAKEEEEGRPRR
jgi:hypothetical protein